MQNANVRRPITLQQVSPVVVAKLVHLNDALIVELDVQIVLKDVNLLGFLPVSKTTHHVAILAIEATRLDRSLAIVRPVQTTRRIVHRQADWPANVALHQTLLVAAVQRGH